MKIKHKYLRNRAIRTKYWKIVRNKSHPYETYMPDFNGFYMFRSSTEEQVKRNFEALEVECRCMDSGHHRHTFHAPKFFRKLIWKQRKSRERMAMSHIRQGDYDYEVPKFKKDADWLYF